MRCPYCGSESIIWSYSSGDVICSECGSVIDRIYTYDECCLNQHQNLYSSLPTQTTQGLGLSKMTKEYLKLVKDLNKSRKLKGRVYIDHEMFLKYVSEGGNRVKVLKFRLNNVCGYPNEEYVEKVLDIMRKYPRLSSRTERAKKALALITLNMLHITKVNEVELTKLAGLSYVHVKRLTSILTKEKEFIKEVEKTLKNMEDIPIPT
ncbi:MAG: hypothetical protein B7O98_04790 [Zestosphaera tikiterensis]|uniref:TFIIB-type domain-containing protein n=1 Tax=Zestosphaera tikiterensis TaxID=1973259 RepID=A0A2R7Y5J2_9CREN|nr:MAG: hypothetical protein B7O98_04790 [Zestosphaera tikiterensis]